MVVGFLGAVLGVVLGPFLAGLTLVRAGWGSGAGQAVVAGRAGHAAAGRGSSPRWPRSRSARWPGRSVLSRSCRRTCGWPAVGVTLAVIDIETLRLPDRLTLPSYPVGLVLLAIPADWPALGRAVLAAAVTGGAAFLLALLAPRGGLGLGDVKLLGVLGLFLGWLGWGVLVVGVALGFALGALVAVGHARVPAGRAARPPRVRPLADRRRAGRGRRRPPAGGCLPVHRPVKSWSPCCAG